MNPVLLVCLVLTCYVLVILFVMTIVTALATSLAAWVVKKLTSFPARRQR